MKNDSIAETFALSNFHNQLLADSPILFMKIVPLLSFGPSFNFSIWYIELIGIEDELIVNENLQRCNEQKEVLTIRYILKHLRNRGLLKSFEALEAESNVQLEDDEVTKLYRCLLDLGDFEKVENIMEKLIDGDKNFQSLV